MEKRGDTVEVPIVHRFVEAERGGAGTSSGVVPKLGTVNHPLSDNSDPEAT